MLTQLFAQRNEIGTHLTSYSVYTFGDKYSRTGVANQDKKPFTFLNGITYKRYINEHILRTSFTYRNLSSVAETNYYILREGSYDESILKLGYERDLNIRKLTPYIAADMSMLYIGFEGYSRGDAPGYNDYELNGIGIGFSPAFGLKFKLTESLILNAESSLDLAYLRFNHTETMAQHGIVKFKTYNFVPRFNPLQKLSLNVNSKT